MVAGRPGRRRRRAAHVPQAAGQLRGLSWLAPAIIPANELDQLLDALVVRAKVSAMLMGFIRSPDGSPIDLQAELPSLEPGTMARLGLGEDVSFNNPTPSAENGSLVAVKIREIAAGVGLPPHLVDQDLTGANYSSLRAGLLPFRARVELIRYAMIAPILDRIWARVTLAEPCEWLVPAFLQVDPQKQVEADLAELGAGLTSRRKLVAARGRDLAELDAELAAEGWQPAAAQPSKTESADDAA
jgi:capsid protein